MCEMQQCPSITTTSIFELDYEKKINIYPSVSSGIGGGTKTEKNESNNSFYNFLFSLYNKLQTDSDWLGSHIIIIEKMDLINSIVGINQ